MPFLDGENVPKIFAGFMLILLLVSIGLYSFYSGCSPVCKDFEKNITVSQAHTALKSVAMSNKEKFINNFFEKLSPQSCGITDPETTKISEI